MDTKPTVYTKDRYRLKYRGTKCSNCEHPLDLSDKFCPNCSQANSTKKMTLRDYFDELFSSILSYDSKLLKTLSALLLRPGRITKDYIEGKRVSYTNPFRFLLSLAIVYFLMINFTGDYSRFDRFGVTKENELPDDLEGLKGFDVSLNVEGEKVILNEKYDSIKRSNKVQGLLESIRKRDSLILVNPRQHFHAADDKSFRERMAQKYEVFNSLIQNDSISSYGEAIEKYELKKSLSSKMAFSTANGYRKMRRQPGTFISSLISKLPFAVFLFLPVFALFIWLVYIRKKYNYTDHLIFSFHNTSLLFILLIISYLIDSIFNVNSNWIFVSIFSVYLFRAMRKFYQQGVFKTIVKYVFLNGIFFILAIVAIVLLSTGSVLTY